jgi:hypothetical protein
MKERIPVILGLTFFALILFSVQAAQSSEDVRTQGFIFSRIGPGNANTLEFAECKGKGRRRLNGASEMDKAVAAYQAASIQGKREILINVEGNFNPVDRKRDSHHPDEGDFFLTRLIAVKGLDDEKSCRELQKRAPGDDPFPPVRWEDVPWPKGSYPQSVSYPFQVNGQPGGVIEFKLDENHFVTETIVRRKNGRVEEFGKLPQGRMIAIGTVQLKPGSSSFVAGLYMPINHAYQDVHYTWLDPVSVKAIWRHCEGPYREIHCRETSENYEVKAFKHPRKLLEEWTRADGEQQ